jgi:hypothetical protein
MTACAEHGEAAAARPVESAAEIATARQRLREDLALIVRWMEHLREQLYDGEITRRRFNREYAALLDSMLELHKQIEAAR